MRIEYYPYNDEIIKDIESGKIHVFSKSVDKSFGKNVYLQKLEDRDIFSKQPKFMGMGEFKTSLFLSGEIILREEKQVIAFYRSLSNKNRKELGVESYYDVIDIAANFLNFFKLIKEYRLEELENLKKWQKRVYKLFLDIEKDYRKFLSEKNYIDPTFILEEKNYTSDGIKNYKEIVIYNHLFFTPLEKWIVEKLEEEGFDITLKLQMKEEEFCEEKLQLKDVILEDTVSKKEIEIYTVDDEFTELLKILEIKNNLENSEEKNRYEIFDANQENYKYNNFFREVRYLSDLPIYTLLEGIHGAFLSLEVIDGELALDLHSVVEMIKIESIKRKYNITPTELEGFRKIVDEGYKYLTRSEILERKELGEENFIFRIYEHMDKMKNYTSLKEWMKELTYSEKVLLELLEDDKNIGKYFEALSEIEVIEDLEIVDGWKGFFGTHKEKIMEDIKKSEGLLRMILKFLKFKEIDSINRKKTRKAGMDEIKTTSGEVRIFMNMSDIFTPTKKDNTFLFTEQQKIELGIRGLERIRIEEKYNFVRGITTSEKSIILAIKNMDSNSSLSPFVEEVAEKYNIKPIHIKQNIDNYIDLIKIENNNALEKETIKEEKPSKMIFKIEELKNPMSLSAYMCDELFRCKYKMYMRYIERLDREELEVDKNLTRREYGILAHELFEEVLNRLELTKDYSPFVEGRINTDIVMEVLKAFIRQRKLKLPMENEKYYEEIVYKNLVKSVNEFFYKMSKSLRGNQVKKLIVEEKLGMKLLDKDILIKGNAKADLIIETERETIIVDFKTGGLNERQLDFYSILYSGDPEKNRKYIFNVDKGSLEESKKIKMTLEELEEELGEWIKVQEYTRTKSSQCGRCEYFEICRVGEVEDEK